MKATLITLKGFGKHLFLSVGLLCCITQLHAQVTGTKTIGIDYPDVASAITNLNTVGISGAVIINVPAGYTETAPAGGFLLGSTTLNGSTSAISTLTIRKSGTGTNPLLTAPTGTSTTTDGIFIIQGTDYLTMDGIDLTESVANTTPTTWMEWGYGLVKLRNTAPFDGCNNVTIQNCTVTLNRLNTPTVGIYAGNHIATATTALALVDVGDAMSNCRFYANMIQNCVTGISLRGFAAATTPFTLYDQDNDIGGSSIATGNTIRHYGGATSGSGINLQYQNNANVAFNTINNTAGGGIPSTTVLYGIYTQNGTNASITVTDNTVQLTQGTTGSAVYGINTSCAGTGTVSVNNNTLTASGGSTGTMYMIYFGGANTTVNTIGNRFYNINVANSGSLYLIYHSTSATPAYITCTNNFTSGSSLPYVNKTGSGGTVAGYYNNAGSGSGVTILHNNTFSSFSLTGSPTFYGIFDNNGGTGQNKSARNNIISSVSSTIAGTQYGISMGYSATEIFSNNTVSNLNAGTGIVYGIYIGANSNVDSVVGNRIFSLASTGGNVHGIYIASGLSVNVYQDTVFGLTTGGATRFAYGIYQTTATNVNIFKNRLYSITSSGVTGSAYGLYLNSGSATAHNNLIGDINTPNYTGAGGTQLAGIYINGGTAHNVYFNSVYLNGSSTGTDFGSSAIYSSVTPAVTLRNNIFVNRSTPNGSGLTVAYRRSGTSLTTYQAASDNNLFYAGTPGASNVIFYDGTTSYPTLAAYKTLVAPRDGNSVTENPVFTSTTGFFPGFLHISTSTPTQIESGAVNITGITSDAEENIRAGNPGYTGAGTAPDIGAIEGNYMLTDMSAPNISYTALPGACSTGDRTFSAEISDATGVPTSGTLVPRVYFRKGTGTWFSSPGVLTSGSSTSGTWSFTILAAPMGGLVVDDTVSYFVIAQDVASTVHIGADPGAGLVASDVNTVTTFPTSPNRYPILPVLTGTYNVGVGMPYATITDAVVAYNTSCVSGNVVFRLTDATYPGETLPIMINANTSVSPSNTLTIKPAPGVAPSVSGSASAIFILNGADYVTIDGSNGSVTNSICPRIAATRDMTIANTSTSTTSAVIWIQTATGSDSATHNTIRNCNLAGSGNTRTLFAVGSGGTTISYTSSGTNNNSNRIENNSIIATQTGIFSRGANALNKNHGTVINQNLINGTTPDNLRNNGVFTGFEDGITISGNEIANITNGASNDIIGINLGFGNNATTNTMTTGSEVTNATVTYNKLDNITQTNTYSSLGIALAGAASGTTTIANNMISSVLSNSTGTNLSSGIFVGGTPGGTTRVYYNAVSMTGSLTGSTSSSFAIAISGSDPIVDLKNNIFVNNASTGSARIYAIGLAYSVYSNLSSDHNDFYSIGANMGTVNSLAGTGANQATLADWQTTTGNDANSKDVDPVFASPSDLHLTTAAANIPLMNTGVPVSVVTDYDCSSRSSSPDIGLNEFTIPLCGAVTAGAAIPVDPEFCNSGSTTINLSGATVGVGISYQWSSSPDSLGWSAIPGATASTYTTPVITATTFYRVTLSCVYSGLRDSTATSVVIHPLPVIVVTPDGGGICTDGTGLNMTSSGASSYTWSPAAGLSTTTGASVNANPATTTTYTVTGTDVFGCVNTHVSTITVTTAPDTFSVSPSATTMCEGGVPVLLSATGAAVPSAGPDSVASGTISVVVPDALAAGASTLLSISGIPTGATITGVSVRFNITMTYDGDLTLNLTAPNGETRNLVNRRGAGGDNFVNTVVSSAGGILFTAGVAPFTNTFTADASLTSGITSMPVTTTLWADLYSIPNGSWTLSARDWAGGDVATITSWTLVIDYTYNPAITWFPLTGLFTDAAATIPYTGGDSTSVYAQPPATTTYTATLSLGACTNRKTVTVNVTPLPDAGTISGPSAVCTGSSITLTGSVSGGTWVSTTPAATVSSSGVVVGVAAGTDTILYIVTSICGVDTTFKVIDVELSPVAGTVAGPSVVCAGSSIAMTASVPGGTWTTSSSALATVSGSGVVTGVSAGPVTISYTVSNSCGTVVATKLVTVNPSPDAGSITGFSMVCEGATITLSASVSGGTWLSSNGNTTVSGSGVVTGVTAGVDTILYIVTNSCGVDTASHIITIHPLPFAGVITGPSDVCVGASITLANATPGGVWSSCNARATVSSAGVVTGVSPGLDTISYRVTNSCGVTAATRVITIHPIADAGVISGASVVCTDQTITLTSTVPGGTWSSSNPSATVSGAGVVTGVSTGTVIINYTFTNICGTDVSAVPVTVYQSPTVFATTGGGTYCAGGIGFHVGTTGSQSGVTYQLYNGTIAVGSPLPGTGAALDFGLQTAPGTYTVAATNPSSGCTINMSGSAVIYVNPIVPPTVSISASATIICAGSSVTLTAIPVNGGATPTYQWKVNGVNTGTAVTFTYAPANGDVVKVTIRSSSCATPDTGSATIVMTVNPYTPPSVTITAGPGNAVCAGTPVTFTAHPVVGGTTPTFRWTKNGVNVATGPAYTYIPANGDNVYVVMRSNHPCRVGDTAISNHIIMSVSAAAAPSVTITARPGTLISAGQSDTLMAIVVNGGPSPTYQWAINGIFIPGATTAFYVSNSFANGDVVSCTVITSGPCGGRMVTGSVTIAVANVGVEEIGKGKTDLRLSPNPNKGTFTLKGTLASANSEPAEIEITNMLGQVVHKGAALPVNGVLNEQFALLGNLPNGMYLLTIRSDDEKIVFHFVLEQ